MNLFAFRIDCIYLIFLQVSNLSCFNLGGSIEPSEPPLEPPQKVITRFILTLKFPLLTKKG